VVAEPPIRDIFDLARAKPDRVYRDGINWMWLGRGDVARIICPRCWNGGGGTLGPIRIKGSDDLFYLCDECDATWPAEQFDWDDYIIGMRDRESMLHERALRDDDYEAG
jgi:hypothetical protein